MSRDGNFRAIGAFMFQIKIIAGLSITLWKKDLYLFFSNETCIIVRFLCSAFSRTSKKVLMLKYVQNILALSLQCKRHENLNNRMLLCRIKSEYLKTFSNEKRCTRYINFQSIGKREYGEGTE